MTLTLTPKTEALLREKAERSGSDVSKLLDVIISDALVDNPAHLTKEDVEASYRAMAADEEREAEALEWSEGTLGKPSR